MTAPYLDAEPSHAEVVALNGPTLLEFGAPWCGVCRATQPAIEAALAAQSNVRHVKVADGPGKPLGRAFRVKLWPTLVLLRNGTEVERLVRPTGEATIRDALRRLAA
jgi:thioredoxin 1